MLTLEHAACPPLAQAAPAMDSQPGASKRPWASVENLIPQGYRLDADGLYREKENGEDRISGPVWVSARTRDPQGEEWGIFVQWIDPDGKERKRAFPRDLLHDKRGIPLAQALSISGLEVIPGCEGALVKYLGSFDVPQRLRAVAQLGWLPGEDLAYVLPDRVIDLGKGQVIVYQPERYSPTTATMRQSGTLEQWQKHVGEACKGNPRLIFALCAAFSGPLLKLANMESGGFHLFGASSKGKTTALQCAGSVWGNGADPATSDDSYIGRWNTTGNALEAIAAAHNDGFLILDELGTCSAQDFGKVIYDLFGGLGKSRLSKDALLKPRRSWRMFGLSSGEISVRQRIENEKGTAHAGQLIRLIDMRVENNIIVNTHGKSPAEFVKRLKSDCARFYGCAGPEFLRHLVLEFSDLANAVYEIRTRVDEWCAGAIDSGRQISGLHDRGMQRFGLVAVAGIFASKWGISPNDSEEVDRAILEVARSWLDDAESLSDGERGIRAVREFIEMHQFSRFLIPKDSAITNIRDCAGYRSGEFFMFNDAGFKEACGEYDLSEVAEELRRRGLLGIDDSTRFKAKHLLPGGQRHRFYQVRDSILKG